MIDTYKQLLSEWNAVLITDEGITDTVDPEIVSGGWFGREPASDAEISNAERSLDCALPSTFRAFLSTSNGWEYPGNYYDFPGRIFSASELRWFREENQDLIEDFHDPTYQISNEQYFVYGSEQDCVHMRGEYLEGCLQISEVSEGGVYLLNPAIRQPNGEWEAWWFANSLPGAIRHKTFLELLKYEVKKYR